MGELEGGEVNGTDLLGLCRAQLAAQTEEARDKTEVRCPLCNTALSVSHGKQTRLWIAQHRFARCKNGSGHPVLGRTWHAATEADLPATVRGEIPEAFYDGRAARNQS